MENISKSPILSVLMPVYNMEEFVQQAVDSVLSQTYSNFELLIMNDGSTDSTSEILASYADERIKVFTQGNLGVTEARNKLLNLAKGKYIAWLDGDDISFPFRFEKQVRFLENNPDYIMVGSSAIIIDKKNKFLRILFVLDKDETIRWQLFFNNAFVNSSGVFYREIAINNKLEFEKNQVGDDYNFWRKIIKHGKVKNILEPLIAYRVHDNQISTQLQEEQKSYEYTIIQKRFEDFEISISSEDIDVIKKWYWGEPHKRSSENLDVFSKIIDLVEKSSEIEHFDFIKMFRVYYDRLLFRNYGYFSKKDLSAITKMVYKVDKFGVLTLPVRLVIYPLKILWRVIKKSFAIVSLLLDFGKHLIFSRKI